MILIYIDGALRLSQAWGASVDLRDEIGRLVWECTRERKRCAVVRQDGNLLKIVGRT